jgi:toxin ParE1/3/4
VTSYVLSPRAQADIEEIWDYTAANWDAKQAELYIRQLQLSVEAVAHNPRLGRPCDEVRVGYRKYLAGSHVLFYRLTDTGVDVVRILHGRMDFSQHL